MEEHKKMALLGSAPINRSLLALGVPTMTGMLINALYSLADAYFVGELGTDQMGAVTVAFPLGQAVVGMGLLFGNGAAARLSRLLGRGDRAGADRTASTAIYGSLLAGAAAILLSIAFLEPALRGLGAIESVMPYALSYARIYLLFSIFNVFNVAMNNVVSSEGGAKTAMWALMAGAALNVALDPLFIRVLGVAGAALATAVSQLVSTLVYLRCIRRKRSVFSFDVRSCCLRGEVLWEILKIGVPTLLFQLLTSLSIGMINSAAKEYGPSALAAMGPVTRMMSMGTLVVFGFLKGFQPIAGFSYGARQFDRLREAVRAALLWSTGFCVVFGLSAALFAQRLMSLFTKGDGEMVRIGAAALRASGLSFVLFGFYTVYSFLFLVMGRAREGCFLGACRQGLCFVPAIVALPAVWGLRGVLWAQPAADVLAAAIAAVMALRLHRALRREEASRPAGE